MADEQKIMNLNDNSELFKYPCVDLSGDPEDIAKRIGGRFRTTAEAVQDMELWVKQFGTSRCKTPITDVESKDWKEVYSELEQLDVEKVKEEYKVEILDREPPYETEEEWEARYFASPRI